MDIPPLPTPFPIPTPDPLNTIDTSPLWSTENISGLMSAFQSVFLLAKENYILTVTIVLLIIAGCLLLIARSVSRGSSEFVRIAETTDSRNRRRSI